MEKMNLLDEFEGMIDDVEIARMVNKLKLSPLDMLAIAAAVFEGRGTKQRLQKRKATADIDNDDAEDDYEAAMLKHERRLERERYSVSNFSCSPHKKLKTHVNGIMCYDTNVKIFKKPFLDESLLPKSSVPNLFSHSAKKKRSTTTGHGITSTVSLSKQERLKREKRLKEPMIDDESKTSIPLPLLKQGSLSYLPDKKGNTGIVFYDPKSKEERLRRREKVIKELIILDDEASPTLPIQAKKTPKKRSISLGSQTPPDMPIEIKNKITAMGGTDLKLVIQKQLFETDCRSAEGRLSIPIRQIRAADFLTEEEKAQLETKQENGVNKSEIKVQLIDPKGQEWNPSLRKWDMKKNNSGANNPMYVLNSEWNNIVKANKLKPNNICQLWSFRINSKLFLALVKVGGQRNNEGESSGNGGTSTSHSRDNHEQYG